MTETTIANNGMVPQPHGGALKPIQKGECRNPSGRPKGIKDIAALARENSTAAMRKIIKLIDSEDDRIALAAATQVLDRAIGKPTQTVEVDANVTHHGEEPVSDTIAWVRSVLGSRQNGETEEPLPH